MFYSVCTESLKSRYNILRKLCKRRRVWSYKKKKHGCFDEIALELVVSPFGSFDFQNVLVLLLSNRRRPTQRGLYTSAGVLLTDVYGGRLDFLPGKTRTTPAVVVYVLSIFYSFLFLGRACFVRATPPPRIRSFPLGGDLCGHGCVMFFCRLCRRRFSVPWSVEIHVFDKSSACMNARVFEHKK